MSFDLIKNNYDRGLWNKKMVQMAVTKGVITQEQADTIFKKKPNSSSCMK